MTTPGCRTCRWGSGVARRHGGLKDAERKEVGRRVSDARGTAGRGRLRLQRRRRARGQDGRHQRLRPQLHRTPPAPSRRPGPPRPPANPVVSIQTTLGEIVVELDAQGAPTTTSEFLYYVRKGHYDGTIFHQVIKNQAAIVGGQYLHDLTARPGRTPIVRTRPPSAVSAMTVARSP